MNALLIKAARMANSGLLQNTSMDSQVFWEYVENYYLPPIPDDIIASPEDITQTNSPNRVATSTGASDIEGNVSSVGSHENGTSSATAIAKNIPLNALSDELDLLLSQDQSDPR